MYVFSVQCLCTYIKANIYAFYKVKEGCTLKYHSVTVRKTHLLIAMFFPLSILIFSESKSHQKTRFFSCILDHTLSLESLEGNTLGLKHSYPLACEALSVCGVL